MAALSPATTRVAAGVAGRTGSRQDSLQRGVVRVTMWFEKGLAGHTGSSGSATATTTYGPACVEQNPYRI
jgi:hypothetical protein